jgi:DNA-binding transcriptional ArsR family regulator
MSLSDLPHNHGQAIEEILALLPNTDDFQIVAELFRQLSDCSRIRIFWLLCHCEQCVINLSAIMSMSSPAVSHHLKQLKAAGLITSRRVGKEVYYRAADTAQVSVLHNMLEALVSISCPIPGQFHVPADLAERSTSDEST